MKFKPNSVALVTGGSRGIGRAIVLRLAAEGCDVAFTYNSNPDAADAVTIEAAQSGKKIRALKCDVANATEVNLVIENIVTDFGRLDIVVNNAGITKDGLLMRMSEDDWDSVIRTNLKGAFNVTKAVTKPLMGQRSGKIINISSVVGVIGNAGQANYVASKAGLIGFTKSIAKELASRNIQVNAIAPGYVVTDMTEKLSETQKKSFAEVIPAKRGGTPEEIAAAVSFLASEDANYITGQVLNVDGGMVM